MMLETCSLKKLQINRILLLFRIRVHMAGVDLSKMVLDGTNIAYLQITFPEAKDQAII